MDNEILELNTEQILVQQGAIEWNQYKDLKRQAEELAENILTVEVNEENIKHSKTLLAQVNKRCKELDDRRIKIKNVMMEPYKLFEAQVKEIVGIVKEADEVVRKQVRQLEEEERQQKQALLEDLFNKRLVHYSFRDLFSFSDFLKPKHLNKTTTVDSVEREMIEFFEKIAREMHAIEQMPNGKSVLRFYLETKDLAQALTKQHQKEEQERRIEAAYENMQQAEEKIGVWEFSIFNEKDAKLAALLLQQNNIKFEMEVF